jgi:hypothetical protein
MTLRVQVGAVLAEPAERGLLGVAGGALLGLHFVHIVHEVVPSPLL